MLLLLSYNIKHMVILMVEMTSEGDITFGPGNCPGTSQETAIPGNFPGTVQDRFVPGNFPGTVQDRFVPGNCPGTDVRSEP